MAIGARQGRSESRSQTGNQGTKSKELEKKKRTKAGVGVARGGRAGWEGSATNLT